MIVNSGTWWFPPASVDALNLRPAPSTVNHNRWAAKRSNDKHGKACDLILTKDYMYDKHRTLISIDHEWINHDINHHCKPLPKHHNNKRYQASLIVIIKHH